MDSERRSGQTKNRLEGRYANYFKIGYNAFELIIDCGQCYPENDEPQVHTRLITTPSYGKALLKTLSECIDEYDKCYGRNKD